MCRIDRREAVERLKKLEQAAKDPKEAMCYVRAFNAIMSCRVIPKGRKAGKADGGAACPDR